MANNLTRWLRTIKNQQHFYCSKSSNSEKDKSSSKIKKEKRKVLPEAPTTCCMSGCANCVWIEYAEKLCDYYQDGGAKAIEEIEKTIDDPNLKAFLLHELRMKNIKK